METSGNSSNLEVMDTLCSSGSTHQSLHRSTSSIQLLNEYNSSLCRFTVDKLITREIKDPLGGKKLSTEEIMRVAAAYFIRSHVEGEDDNLVDPSTLSSSGLTHDEIKKVDLAIHLLAAANNLSNQQFDRASNLLVQCCKMCSCTGSPVERVVHYFSYALQERINRETGQWSSLKRPRTSEDATKAMAIELGIQTKQPFLQLVQFISVQTIIDHVACSKKIHIIDISIRHGLQWATLMQDLATRSKFPVEQLKISAIGTCEAEIAGTGKMLARFANTLSLALDFQAVIVTDLKDLKEEMFEVEEEETVCVYSSMEMGNMIAGRDGLDNLMTVLRKLKPCVMTVAEVEAKLNSSCFNVRFTEALFYFSALFDYLDGFMSEHDDTRMAVESRFISQGIINIIANEGSQRVVRHVGITVWRSFFARFGLMETKLNKWSMYQADLLVDRFAGGDSCTINKNGESLILGWRGTPLVFVSAWEFL